MIGVVNLAQKKESALYVGSPLTSTFSCLAEQSFNEGDILCMDC